MNGVQWGDIGTWVGSIGTVLAVLFAWYVGHKQGIEAKKRQQREQAERISSWVAAVKMPLPVKLSNQSGDPVYDVIVSVVLVQGAGPQDGKHTFMQQQYKVLPPGTFLVSFDNYPGGAMHTKPGTEIAFTDKAGLHWLKDKNGKLHSLKSKSPSEYYGLGQPIGWLYLDDSK